MFYDIDFSNRNKEYVIALQSKNAITRFKLSLCYNFVGEYWCISIRDAIDDTPIISNVPLVVKSSEDTIYGLFTQVIHLGLGDPIIQKVQNLQDASIDSPNFKNIDTDFEVLWCK